MSNLYMPVSAAIISSIILFIYVSKEKLKIKENTIYQYMLICAFLDSLFVTAIFIDSGPGEHVAFIKFLNRLDYMVLVLWTACLCRYTHAVIHKKDENRYKRCQIIRRIITGIAYAACVVIWILDIEAITEAGITVAIVGPAVYFTFTCCALYILASLLIIICNIKNATRQIVPVFTCLAIASLCVLAYSLDSEIPGVSLVLAIVNLTMYFTIENPDVKLLEKVNTAREQAIRANQAKTDFLSNMSHEIRTPINAIVGLAECIQNDESLEAAKTDARGILSASENLLELVNGILDISKIESGRMEVINKEYDFVEVSENLAGLIRARIGEKPLELRTSFSEDIPRMLYGDESKIRQIMTNLLTNAVKYTDEGHIDFEIKCNNKDNIANLTISVSDTGRGIKEEDIGSLFDKFKRLEEDRNVNVEGTGLGLAITRQFVEMLGGTITVSSKYGEGSVFTFNVSQEIRGYEHKSKEQVSDATREYPGRRILVVDDTAMNLMVAKRILELFKIDVDTAASGEECIEKCRSESYDLILLDDMMPNMSGTETLMHLKEIDDFNIPVIAFTANAIDGMREHYLGVGYSGYLSKPLAKPELGQTLEKYLG